MGIIKWLRSLKKPKKKAEGFQGLVAYKIIDAPLREQRLHRLCLKGMDVTFIGSLSKHPADKRPLFEWTVEYGFDNSGKGKTIVGGTDKDLFCIGECIEDLLQTMEPIIK